jgi:hypothetical protein
VGVEAAPCAIVFKNTTEVLENLKAIQSFKHAILQSCIFGNWEHLRSLTNKKVKGI